jgi:pimeloyl-ACP methyl ester carboxylesterase
MTSHPSMLRRLSRRSLLRATTAAGIAVGAVRVAPSRSTLAGGIGRRATSASHASTAADATPAPVDGLAQTPLGDQLAWFLAAVNGGGTSLTEADVVAHVAPTFLAFVPPAQLIGLVKGLAAGYGALKLDGVTRPPTATQAVALVTAAVGIQLALPIAVEAAAPHRITGLNVYPVPSADGAPILPVPSNSAGSEAVAPLIDIGGRRLYRAEAGSGGPTVVLEAGLPDSAAPWSGVIPALASFTRVVSYDRPNTIAGASDRAPAPRTAADVVADLHALLEAAAVPGPYVLVGHSVGGLFVRLYASRHPDEVAGLVLVDASHEDQDVRRQAMVSADLFAAEQQAVHANTEGIDLDASFAQVRAARAAAPLRPMPLVVLSAGQADPARFPAGWPMEAEAQLHDELQMDLAGLVPGGRHVVAEQSGHYVQQGQPDLVVEAIRAVVGAVRDPSTWETHPSGTPVS